MQRGDVAGHAVDHKPGAGLPAPVDWFAGQAIVQTERTLHNEGAVGDFVHGADGPLALLVVDRQRTDAQAGGVVVPSVGGSLGGV